MNPLQQKIIAFSRDPKNAEEMTALFKVGLDLNQSVNEIFRVVLVNMLLRFHNLPTTITQSN